MKRSTLLRKPNMFDAIRTAQAEAFTVDHNIVSNIRRTELRHRFNNCDGPIGEIRINDIVVESGKMEYLKTILRDRG